MRSGLHVLGPTYPMIPHTLGAPSRVRGFSPETRKSPAFATHCVGGRSTELSTNESSDATTEVPRLGVVLSLRQDTDHGLCSGGADEHAASLGELRVHALHLGQKARRELAIRDRDALLSLREARHDRGRFAQRLA